MGEPRLVLLVMPVEEHVGRKGGYRLFDGPQMLGSQRFVRVGPEVVVSCSQPVHPWLVRFVQIEDAIKARQHTFPLAQRRIVDCHRSRIDALVAVSEQRWRVARPNCRKRNVVESRIERGPIGYHPIVHLVGAGVQRGSTGGARCSLAVVAGEPDALFSKVV